MEKVSQDKSNAELAKAIEDGIMRVIMRIAYFVAAFFIVKLTAIGAFISVGLFNGGAPNWPGTPIGITLALTIFYGAYKLLRYLWKVMV